MDKNLKTLVVLTIVLLNTLLSYSAHAGFYDWLVSKESAPVPLVALMSNDPDKSYAKIFSWDSREPEDYGLEKLIPEKPEPKFKVVRESVRQVTAYNVGDIYQTDSTPCIGAYPKVNLCDEIEKGVPVCAANFVPLGTMLRIVSGDDQDFECIVWDRMHSRFSTRVDIAMSASEKTQAKQFGLQKLKVQVLEKLDEEVSI